MGSRRPPGKKFMQVLTKQEYDLLKRLAKRRHLSIQTLLRAIIIPDWLENEKSLQKAKE